MDYKVGDTVKTNSPMEFTSMTLPRGSKGKVTKISKGNVTVVFKDNLAKGKPLSINLAGSSVGNIEKIKESTILITEEVKIGDVILEVGDKIRVLDEEKDDSLLLIDYEIFEGVKKWLNLDSSENTFLYNNFKPRGKQALTLNLADIFDKVKKLFPDKVMLSTEQNLASILYDYKR